MHHRCVSKSTISSLVLLTGAGCCPVFSLLSVIRPTPAVLSANLMIVLDLKVAKQSCVYREYSGGLKTALGCSSVKDDVIRCVCAYLHHPGSAYQKVKDSHAQ